jgi:hypothetical protein
VIEIEEPPDIRACAAHSVPLVWHFSAQARVWKAWEPVEENPEMMRRHRCEHHGDPLPSWKDERTFDPETFSRGMAKARAAVPDKSAPKE